MGRVGLGLQSANVDGSYKIITIKEKLVFWWDHLENIWFLEPNFMKYEN